MPSPPPSSYPSILPNISLNNRPFIHPYKLTTQIPPSIDRATRNFQTIDHIITYKVYIMVWPLAITPHYCKYTETISRIEKKNERKKYQCISLSYKIWISKCNTLIFKYIVFGSNIYLYNMVYKWKIVLLKIQTFVCI